MSDVNDPTRGFGGSPSPASSLKKCDNCRRKFNPVEGKWQPGDDGVTIDLCCLCMMNLTVNYRGRNKIMRNLEEQNTEMRELLTRILALRDYSAMMKRLGEGNDFVYEAYRDETQEIWFKIESFLKRTK